MVNKRIESGNKTLFLKALMLLAIVGFFTSVYLVQSHYAPPEEGSLCDFSESVSCSIVNTSSYSVLFSVPVAVFGTIWFIVLLAILYNKLKNEKKGDVGKRNVGKRNAGKGNAGKSKSADLDFLLVFWSSVGLISVIYLIIAEIILKAICPFCTIVHIIVLLTFLFAIKYCGGLKKLNLKKINLKKMNLTPWIVAILILNIIPLLYFNIDWQGDDEESLAELNELANCISESGVKMYGSFRCGICAKTRDMFGEAFENINEIECHPQGENSQLDLCLEKGVAGTPTWIMEVDGEEIKRNEGFLSTDELREFSGCLNEGGVE